MTVFRLMRIVFLLSIFFVILFSTWMTEKQMAAWERPILVTVYPIAADKRAATLKYAQSVDEKTFAPVNTFFEREAGPYGFQVTPAFRFQVAPVGDELPPAIPDQFSPARIALWSLQMRWWAWMKDFGDGLIQPDIQMFVLYHSLEAENEIGISVGMRKGRYGVVKAIARKTAGSENLVVFTHEMLHVLGAADKYVISTGEPIYPEGYAQPEQRPLFPQRYAEIMGGRIPLSSITSTMPGSLEECKIGRQTAREIGFFDKLLEF
ncbi:MAG: hypothetical protein PVJ33_11215 [Lysobacterales bacterium]